MPYCKNCGTELSDQAQFCPNCGAKTEGAASPGQGIPPTAREEPQDRGTGAATQTAYSGLGRRFVAHLFDGLMVLVAYIVIGSVVAMQTGDLTEDGFAMEGGPALVAMLLTFVVSLAYFSILESFGGGRTLGKLIAGIRVADMSGGRCSFGQALTRNILRLVDGFAFYLVGIVLVLMSDKNQRLGDRVAHTVVINVPKKQSAEKKDSSSGVRFSMGSGSGYLDT